MKHDWSSEVVGFDAPFKALSGDPTHRPAIRRYTCQSCQKSVTGSMKDTTALLVVLTNPSCPGRPS